MRIAFCTQDGVTYEAADFSQTEDFTTKRNYLVCPRCNGPAFYRRPTRNGREACFGARPHAEGCDLAAVEHDGTPIGQGEEEDEVFTTGQRIVLDFNFGAAVTDLETRPVELPADTDNVGAHNGQGLTAREIMYRRMSSLLRTLIDLEEFRRSTQIIEIAEQGEFTVTEFFVNFAEVTEEHTGSYHGYWGMVSYARRDANGTLWFNSGGEEDPSVLMDQAFIQEAFLRFNIENEANIAGAYLLVVGELRVGPSGKRYVQITDPSRFTLRLA